LSRDNPGFERQLENIADQISLTRHQAGVHYLSDLVAGKYVAELLDPYIDRIEDYRGIIMENDFRLMTRMFLLESESDEPEKLRVLDFDDTVARTFEKVRVETPEGPKYLPSDVFATYELLDGEYFDSNMAFKEFDTVNVEKATPVPMVSDLLKSFTSAPGSRKVLILTARGQEVEPYVMDFLEKKLSIQDPRSKVDFIGVANKDPMAKVERIQDYLNTHPSINFVSFYDDSGKNVNAVKEFLRNSEENLGRKVSGDVRQVVKDDEGNIRLLSPRVDESLDFRSMTRSFLTDYS